MGILEGLTEEAHGLLSRPASLHHERPSQLLAKVPTLHSFLPRATEALIEGSRRRPAMSRVMRLSLQVALGLHLHPQLALPSPLCPGKESQGGEDGEPAHHDITGEELPL
jgi:hypothetical protein